MKRLEIKHWIILLTVLIVVGGVFGYYLYLLEIDSRLTETDASTEFKEQEFSFRGPQDWRKISEGDFFLYQNSRGNSFTVAVFPTSGPTGVPGEEYYSDVVWYVDIDDNQSLSLVREEQSPQCDAKDLPEEIQRIVDAGYCIDGDGVFTIFVRGNKTRGIELDERAYKLAFKSKNNPSDSDLQSFRSIINTFHLKK